MMTVIILRHRRYNDSYTTPYDSLQQSQYTSFTAAQDLKKIAIVIALIAAGRFFDNDGTG